MKKIAKLAEEPLFGSPLKISVVYNNKGQPKTRHLNSMKKIEKLAEEPSFGAPRKTRVVYNDLGQTVETYAFTKIQAIAAAARIIKFVG